ncbi:hypothetical protein E8E12_006074 [Didymella heteroderae]|uniref:Uncharacterized protein n=1 Tax=Didymella heteroderae TaxID=1769908 RepID=A0A9P5BYW4_9PLEO|nr:hypothetical protein E8E12_006074 [Didymella heteroderae]
MSTRHLWDCFDAHKKGHFQAVDELFERGVWIGYFAEESRDTRYRQLPSCHDLEKNYGGFDLPYPEPLHYCSCNDRAAKVIAMSLLGANEAGLFCITIPQSVDRSIKAVYLFRLYKHGVG